MEKTFKHNHSFNWRSSHSRLKKNIVLNRINFVYFLWTNTNLNQFEWNTIKYLQIQCYRELNVLATDSCVWISLISQQYEVFLFLFYANMTNSTDTVSSRKFWTRNLPFWRIDGANPLICFWKKSVLFFKPGFFKLNLRT